MAAQGYGDLTRWQSATPGLVLRGRRAAGGGPIIHFLSGNGFCGGVYWPMLRELAPQYGVFMQDIEGQGESDAPAHFSGADKVVERIPAVIAEQGLGKGQPLIGMGHSFGSQLTVLTAGRNPGLFKALVLTDPILFPPMFWASVRGMGLLGVHPFGKAARRRRDAWPSREAAMNHLRGRGIYKGWDEECFAHFIDHAMHEHNGEWVLRCPRELEAEIFEQPAYPWNAWKKIDVPMLFLRGAQSYPFFPAAEKWAARYGKNVEFQQLPGGHCFMLEHPQAAAKAIKNFLQRHV